MYLRDPNGVTHFFDHYPEGQGEYKLYFSGDPTIYKEYNLRIILPVGSIPGIWGLGEMALADKAENVLYANFTEIVRFEVDDVKMLTSDVNGDGMVNVLDLVLVAANFGKTDATLAHGDVNGDGEVNREDILAVLEALESAAGAPAAVSTTASLQRWIDQAKKLNRTDADFQKGIAVLQNLLKALEETETVSKATALLANYPNPFNPETWIPYQLAAPADVRISIYAADGKLVRSLSVGSQPAGMYQSRSRAAHWDGRNALGEPMASGVYFYTLTAGDFTATRKMLIRK